MFKQVKSALFWYYLFKFRRRVILIILLLVIAFFANAIYGDVIEYLKLKDSYELILKNVREDKNIDSKFNINNGFIVNFKDNFFQGSKALEFLNSVVNKDTFLGKLHFFFKYDNLFSNFLYKILFILRKLILFLMQKKSKI